MYTVDCISYCNLCQAPMEYTCTIKSTLAGRVCNYTRHAAPLHVNVTNTSLNPISGGVTHLKPAELE